MSALTPDADYRRCKIDVAQMRLTAVPVPDGDPWLQRIGATRAVGTGIECCAMRIAAALIAVSFPGSSLATLPPATDAAKAQAAIAAAKTAWTDKVAQYQRCRAMDRTAERYRDSLSGRGERGSALSAHACVRRPGSLCTADCSRRAAARSRGRPFASATR
jgi:hypothetical protein